MVSKTTASSIVCIDRDASGLPTRSAYSPSTPVYPAVAIQSNEPAAAASRDASLIGYVDDLLDLLQDRGGMSAEWCETEIGKFEKLLRGA